MPEIHAFKKGPSLIFVPHSTTSVGDRDAFHRIRCPLCEWQPTATSVWACYSEGTPEPFFGGCGTVWNTFETKGRCPGCAHQWQWTSCLSCHGWSRHDDWYVEEPGD